MINSAGELFKKVETLKDMLISRAKGGSEDANQYKLLRHALLSNPRLKSKLPMFLQTYQNLDEFWNFIKQRSEKYAQRSDYLTQEFAPALAMLEFESAAPVDEVVSAMLSSIDSEHVYEVWQRALERRINDPEGAITLARTLLESVCKHILDESVTDYDNKEDLPKLYRMASEQMNLAPSQQTEEVFKQILGNCQAVIAGLGSLRNQLSDAHGKGAKGVKPDPRHAELAVNLAGTMATFLIATWEVQNTKFRSQASRNQSAA